MLLGIAVDARYAVEIGYKLHGACLKSEAQLAELGRSPLQMSAPKLTKHVVHEVGRP